MHTFQAPCCCWGVNLHRDLLIEILPEENQIGVSNLKREKFTQSEVHKLSFLFVLIIVNRDNELLFLD